MKTKIWFIVVLSILLAATIARAQLIKAVGLKAGAAISNIRLTDVTPVIKDGRSATAPNRAHHDENAS